jgi:hypothetical protein
MQRRYTWRRTAAVAIVLMSTGAALRGDTRILVTSVLQTPSLPLRPQSLVDYVINADGGVIESIAPSLVQDYYPTQDVVVSSDGRFLIHRATHSSPLPALWGLMYRDLTTRRAGVLPFPYQRLKRTRRIQRSSASVCSPFTFPRSTLRVGRR